MSKRSGCFLLLGQDHWSKSQYIQKVKQEVLTSAQDIMNYYEAQEKDVQVDKLKDVIETLPFFAEYKLVYLKDTGYFKPGRKEESEKFEALINDLPEYIVLLVDEREADKRSKLYKTMKSNHINMDQNYTYDVVFNDDYDSNNKGMNESLEYCKEYIRQNNGTNHSYFEDYEGGTVSIVCNETGETVYEEEVR